MNHQTPRHQSTFVGSLDTEKCRLKNKRILWNLGIQGQQHLKLIDHPISETLNSPPILKKSTSELVESGQLDDLLNSEDRFTKASQQISSEVLQVPRDYHGLELEQMKAQILEQNELRNSNRKLNQYIKKLTAQKRQYEKNVQQLEDELRRKSESESQSKEFQEKDEEIENIKRPNVEWDEEELSERETLLDSSPYLKALDKQIKPMRKGAQKNSAQGKYKSEVGDLQQNSCDISEICELTKKNIKLTEELNEKAKEIEKLNSIKDMFEKINQQNRELKEIFLNQGGILERQCDKDLENTMEIERLNTVLKKEIQARNQLQIKYQKLQEMIKLTNSLQSVHGRESLNQTKSVSEEKADLFLQIKSSLKQNFNQLETSREESFSDLTNKKKYDIFQLEEYIDELKRMLRSEEEKWHRSLQKVEGLEQTVRLYEQITDKLEGKVKVLQDEGQELKKGQVNQEKRAKLNAKVVTLQKNSKYSEKYIQYLEDEVSRLHQNSYTFSFLKQLNHQYQKSIQYNQYFRNQNNKLKKLLSKHHTKYQKNIKLYQHNISYLQDELSRLKFQKSANLQLASAKIQDLLQITQQSHQQVKIKVQALQQQLSRVYQVNAEINEEKEGLSNKISGLERKQKYLQEQLAAMKEQEEDQIAQLEDLQDRIQEHEQKLELYTQDNNRLKQQLINEKIQNQKITSQFEEIQKESEKLKQIMKEEFQQSIKSLEKQVAEEKSKNESALNTICFLQTNVSKVESEIIKLRSKCMKLDQLKSRNNQYAEELLTHKENRILLESIVEEQSTQIQALEADKRKLSDKINSLQGRSIYSFDNKMEESKKSQILSRNKWLEEKCEKLSKKQSQLLETIKILSSEFEKLKVYLVKVKPQSEVTEKSAQQCLISN